MVLLPRVVAQRLEGSRFGASFLGLANLFYHEPCPNVRQQAAPGNDPSGWQLYGVDLNESKAAVS